MDYLNLSQKKKTQNSNVLTALLRIIHLNCNYIPLKKKAN